MVFHVHPMHFLDGGFGGFLLVCKKQSSEDRINTNSINNINKQDLE